MRNLRANLSDVYYKMYIGEEEIVDDAGNATGSYIPKYGDLMCVRLCVSPNRGAASSDQFGNITDYDRTMTTADTHCEIDENSVLWLDGADTDGAWNYVVKKRAVWKNSIQFAVKQVNVSK